MMKIAPAVNNGIKRLSFGRRVPMLLIVVLLGSLLSFGGCGDDDEGGTVVFPKPIPQESRDWLFDVYGTAANDVYAGGNQGVMYHFDGSTWTLQGMGSTVPITNIWSPTADDRMYATGHRGHIWQNSGSGWSSMTSGTTADLYGVGSFQAKTYAVGAKGTIRALNGSSWGGTGSVMVLLDENQAPTDTLSTGHDLASVVSVNHFFLGGAYFDPRYDGVISGTNGTKGNILAPNADHEINADWILRPLSGEQRVEAEWVLCMTSDPIDLARNYLGTSEGWLFRLKRDDAGRNVWEKFYPEVTDGPGAGIRDIWVDADGNIYMVTDEGRVIYQTADYVFGSSDPDQYRQVLFDSHSSLVGIWGTGPDNIYFTGFYDEVLFHGVHVATPGTGTFVVDEIHLAFPAKSADGGSLALGLDHIGRPLR